jgi:ArsR family transcriptional regulator
MIPQFIWDKNGLAAKPAVDNTDNDSIIRNMSNYRNDKLASIFKALGNPHRLQIFDILSHCCQPGTECDTDIFSQCCVSELDSQLDIAASTLSHHLKELHQAGLIDMRREGKQVFCSINTDTLKVLSDTFSPGTPG